MIEESACGAVLGLWTWAGCTRSTPEAKHMPWCSVKLGPCVLSCVHVRGKGGRKQKEKETVKGTRSSPFRWSLLGGQPCRNGAESPLPTSGCENLVNADSKHELHTFYETLVATAIAADALGNVIRTSGNDKQGFPAKQGVLSHSC